MRCLLTTVLALTSLLLSAVGAAAQEVAKLALLIGNRSYTQEVGPLTNPHRDVGVVADALKRIGFKDPTVLTDLKRSQTLVAVRKFASQLAAAGPGAVGFLYYSGHGAAEQGTSLNYLIPVDAADPSSGSFWDEAVKLDDITSLLRDRAPQAAHFVVFDACRNELKLPDKAASKGFAVVPTLRGMFVAFASEFGRTASDVGERSGPYAKALAAELVKPGLSHLDAFQNVKESVGLATQHKQVPWELNGLSLRVYLAGRNEAKQSEPSAVATQPSSDAMLAWDRVKDSKSTMVLEAYIRRFGDTFYGDLAKARLDELKAAQVAVAAPPKQAAPKPAEPAVLEPPSSAQRRACTSQEIEVDAASGPQCIKPGSGVSFRDCPDCPEMVVAPKGAFTMGSPSSEAGRADDEDQVQVSIAAPFAAGKFAITRGEFAAFVKDTGRKTNGGCVTLAGSEWKQQSDKSWRSPGFEQNDRHPVVCINWDDAKAYVAWLSGKTGKGYRLLSESEREYVARAGTTSPFSWGAQISTSQANYNGNFTYGSGQKGEDRKKTVPVDSFKPNPWGLYNVHGNSWDWTEDCWNPKNAGNPGDGSARATGECGRRVVRGGSWYGYPQGLRSAARDWLTSDNRNDLLGFRVGRTLLPP